MSALRRAGTVLRSVYRFLFEPQPLADLRGQAAHEMILRPLHYFANRNAKPSETGWSRSRAGRGVRLLAESGRRLRICRGLPGMAR